MKRDRKGNSACWRPTRMTGERRSPTCASSDCCRTPSTSSMCAGAEDYKSAFFRFMNVLVKRCKEPLIPSGGEHGGLAGVSSSVHCLGRSWPASQDTVLCLPKSYIARSCITGSSCLARGLGARGRVRHHSGVQTQGPDQGHSGVRFHLSYLVKVLCGCRNANFNVLLDTFSISCDYVVSGRLSGPSAVLGDAGEHREGVLQPSCKPLLSSQFQELEASCSC